MFWFLLKVLCQCPPSRVPLPCMLIELCIFYYCCQGKIRDTFSKGALRGQWTQWGVLLLLHYQSSSHVSGAGLLAFSFSPGLRTVLHNNQSLGNGLIPILHTPRHRRPHARTHTHTLKPCTAAGSIWTDHKECKSRAITLTLSHGDKHVSFGVSLDGAK